MANITLSQYSDLQAAIDYVAGHDGGIVELPGGVFEIPQAIVARSGVNVIGNMTEIVNASPPTTIYSGQGTIGCLIADSIENAHWSDVTFRYTNSALAWTSAFMGTAKRSVIFDRTYFYNDCPNGSIALGIIDSASPTFNVGGSFGSPATGYGLFVGGISVILPVATACPLVNDWYAENRSDNPADWDASAVNCDDQTGGIFNNLVAQGSHGRASAGHGVRVHYVAYPTFNNLVSFSGKPQTNVSTRTALDFTGATCTVLNNPTGIVEDGCNADLAIALNSSGNARPTLNGGVLQIGRGRADGYPAQLVRTTEYAAPILNGTAQQSRLSFYWNYNSADNGRFRPFNVYAYKVIGMVLVVRNPHPNGTLNIGTTPGGSEIAVIPLYTNVWAVNVNQLTIPANSYLYATPSEPCNNNDFVIEYVVSTI